MFECLKCGKQTNNAMVKYMVLPGTIIVPNEYYTCHDHKDLFFKFEDVYNDDGSRKMELQND